MGRFANDYTMFKPNWLDYSKMEKISKGDGLCKYIATSKMSRRCVNCPFNRLYNPDVEKNDAIDDKSMKSGWCCAALAEAVYPKKVWERKIEELNNNSRNI